MKRISILFLQGVIVLVGIVALFIMIRFPLTEGRAENLDLFSIYFDPLILYGYAAAIAFFVALYKASKLLGYIGQNKLFTSNSVRTLRSIKHCAIILSILIVMAGLYIRIFHDKEDDPAGALAMSIVLTFISIAVATAVAVLEKILQNAVDMKSENDLTI
jgi:Mn2+/Fe2+ NRAMP family transporter